MRYIGSWLLAAALAGGAGALAAQQHHVREAQPAQRAQGPAQAAGQIQGTVLDGASGRPLASATVGVWSAADSSLVTGALTGRDGRFRVEGLRPGRYYVRFSFLGYSPHVAPDVSLSPAAPQADLGAVRLAASAVQLEGVEVTAERSQATLAPDRNSYFVRDMPVVAGGTASDVLRNVPALEVDMDGKVSLRGNQNVAVQINGRAAPVRGEQLANFLQQLPASMVERVEVIPNPSARYDPDGMAGIVNLVLRQNADLGTSGGAMLGAGTGGRANASGNLGYQRGPLSLFANYGFFTDERRTTGSTFRENRFLDPRTYLEQQSEGFMSPTSHNLNVSGELRLSGRDVLSTSLLVSRREFSTGDANFYRELGADRSLLGRIGRESRSRHADDTYDYSLSLKRTLEPQKHELSAELRFNRSVNDVLEELTERPLTLEGAPAAGVVGRDRTLQDGATGQWTAQADYTRTSGGLRLETGYKGLWRGFDNRLEALRFSEGAGDFLPVPGRGNAFAYDEQVHAAYAVMSRKLGAWDLQAGLRVEQALTDFRLADTGESFRNDYASLFPSGLVAWNLTDSKQLKASYSRRINRPQTGMLNPFAVRPDPLTLFAGNPYLQPEYTDAWELGYQQSGKWGSLQLTPFYRRTEDVIRRWKTVDDRGVSTTTFRNLATSDSWGTDVTGSWRLGALSGFGGFSAFRMVTDGSNVDADLASDAFGWSSRLSATWRVTPRLDVQSFLMYRAPMDVEQGRIYGHSMLQFGLRQKLAGERASVTLRVFDPFDQMQMAFRTEDARHFQETRRKPNMRGLGISFNYNFGRPPRMRQRPGQEEAPPVADEGIRE